MAWFDFLQPAAGKQRRVLPALLLTFSWQELRHHPWRNAAAVVAVMLGVALALSVHLINASALSEFSQAVRSVNGQPDLTLRAAQGQLDESLYARIASLPEVSVASPVLELSTYAQAAGGARQSLRVLGVDALLLARLAPELLPRPADADDRFVFFAPATVFLNAAAQIALGAESVQLQSGLNMLAVRVAGSVAAGGHAGGDGPGRSARPVRPRRRTHAHRLAAASRGGPG